MSSFSVFSQTKTELLAAALPCLHCFEGGGSQSVEGAVSPRIMSNAMISAIKNRFRFNWPIPQFRP